MKPQEIKKEYVRLRAEGKSYSVIAEQLHISKSTCTKWERELSAQINELKRAEFQELCESYGMTKEARIKKLGDTLEKIEDAIAKADFSTVDPAKLLDFKLKYTEALKGEYIGTKPAAELGAVVVKAALERAGLKPENVDELLNRVRAGEVTDEQASRESAVLANLLKAYDTVEVKAKLDELEAIIGGRQ